MDDLVIAGIILTIIFILVSSIVTWVAIGRTGKLEARLRHLGRRIEALSDALTSAGIKLPDFATEPPTATDQRRENSAPPNIIRTSSSPPPRNSSGVWANSPTETPRQEAFAGAPEEQGSQAEESKEDTLKPSEPASTEPMAEEPVKDVREDKAAEQPPAGQIAARLTDPVPIPTSAFTNKSRRTLEHNFGARLPVWIGGAAFALGGFFLVKYSIDNNLLSPLVRVVLGVLLGLGLLAGGDVIRQRPDFANGRRIAQSLSGAGIAVLYAAVYAATSLYHLIPPALGFAGMAAITATAIVLSLRYGKPIALLGLICGFLAPALVESNDPSAFVLFSYLFCLFAGAMVLIRQQAWWDLAIPALGASLGWALLWTVSSPASNGNLAVGLYLVAIAAVAAFCNHGYRPAAILTEAHQEPDPRVIFGNLGVGGATFIMAIAVDAAHYGLIEWVLFAILALGSIYLAYRNDTLYRFLPWISLAINILLLLRWQPADLVTYGTVLTIFAAIYAGSGYKLFWRADRALPWAGLSGAASLCYFLLAYYKLHLVPGPLSGEPADAGVLGSFIWAGISLALSMSAVYTVPVIQKHFVADAQKEHLLAIFALATTAFLSLAMTIVLDEKNLPLAFAAEVLAVAWISRRIEIPVLRWIAGILALIFAGLLIPQILLLVQLAAFSLIELNLPLLQGIPIIDEPLLRLGLPAAFFICAATLLRRKADDILVRGLELAAIALGAVMGYYLTRQLLNVDETLLYIKAGFLERGAITNVLFLYGLFCFWAGRRYLRSAVSWSGAGLCGLALFRVGYFDLFLYNPIWSHQEIAGWPVINALLLPFGLTAVWTLLATRELAFFGTRGQADKWVRHLKPVPLLLAFVWITLIVRHFYQGSYLDSFGAGNAEVYSYSAAWILFGISLLAAGIVTRDQTLRFASLAVMLISVCKVFLYDTAELEGLYRVFSFFGLGISLLGLSYVYTRFVFGGKEHAEASEDTTSNG